MKFKTAVAVCVCPCIDKIYKQTSLIHVQFVILFLIRTRILS